MQDRPLTGETLAMPDAEVIFYRDFYSAAESDALFAMLTEKIDWKQEHIQVPGAKCRSLG